MQCAGKLSITTDTRYKQEKQKNTGEGRFRFSVQATSHLSTHALALYKAAQDFEYLENNSSNWQLLETSMDAGLGPLPACWEQCKRWEMKTA